MKRYRKRKKANLLLYIIFISSIIGLGYSIINITFWDKDNKETEKQIDEINEEVIISEVIDNDNTIITKQEEKIRKEDPYFDYIKMNLMNVDFSLLKKKNSQTKGWIYVSGTNINYPFVQAKDNDFYLDHSFSKKYNDAGWVFMDYRNNIDKLDKNTIIYAHSRLDKSMFGTLVNILKSDWVKNKDNYVVKLSTEKENTLWQVFSVYKIPTTSDYIQVDFDDDKEFLEWAQMLLERSNHNFNTSVSKNDYILTLSTCYSNTEKTVLHAKLIKKETRN